MLICERACDTTGTLAGPYGVPTRLRRLLCLKLEFHICLVPYKTQRDIRHWGWWVMYMVHRQRGNIPVARAQGAQKAERSQTVPAAGCQPATAASPRRRRAWPPPPATDLAPQNLQSESLATCPCNEYLSTLKRSLPNKTERKQKQTPNNKNIKNGYSHSFFEAPSRGASLGESGDPWSLFLLWGMSLEGLGVELFSEIGQGEARRHANWGSFGLSASIHASPQLHLSDGDMSSQEGLLKDYRQHTLPVTTTPAEDAVLCFTLIRGDWCKYATR